MVVVVAGRAPTNLRPVSNIHAGRISNGEGFPSIGSQPQRGHAPTYIPTPPPMLSSEQVAGSTCSICLDTSANVVTGCKHTFHLRCLDAWYKQHKRCPNCNGRLDHFFVECSRCNMFRVSIALSAIQPPTSNRVCMDCLGRRLSQVANNTTFDRLV